MNTEDTSLERQVADLKQTVDATKLEMAEMEKHIQRLESQLKDMSCRTDRIGY